MIGAILLYGGALLQKIIHFSSFSPMSDMPIMPGEPKDQEPMDPICPPPAPNFGNPGQRGPEIPGDIHPQSGAPDVNPPGSQTSGCPSEERKSVSRKWFFSKPSEQQIDAAARMFAEQHRRDHDAKVCSKGTCGTMNGTRCTAVASYCPRLKKSGFLGYTLEVNIACTCKCKGPNPSQNELVIKDCSRF
jgi:hypothetical protein